METHIDVEAVDRDIREWERPRDCLDAAISMAADQRDLRYEQELRRWLTLEPRRDARTGYVMYRGLSCEEIEMRAALALRGVGLQVTGDNLDAVIRLARAYYRGRVQSFRIINEEGA